jgi:hypothetical protein
MDNKQAISAIRNNWPPSNYTMLREALEMSIKSLEAAESAQTAHNSAMDAIASLCRACEDTALTDETVGMMARDIVKWYRKQLHQ